MISIVRDAKQENIHRFPNNFMANKPGKLRHLGNAKLLLTAAVSADTRRFTNQHPKETAAAAVVKDRHGCNREVENRDRDPIFNKQRTCYCVSNFKSSSVSCKFKRVETSLFLRMDDESIPSEDFLIDVYNYRQCRKKKEKRERQKKLIFLIACIRRRRAREQHQGRKSPLTKAPRKCFWKTTQKLSAKQFRRTFRLTCFQFRLLVSRLRHLLDRNKVMAERAGGLVQAEIKVALLLRMLAGGNYNDLCLIFDLQTSTLYDIFRRTLHVLLLTLQLQGIPENVDELKTMALKFKLSRRGGNPLNGCIGALDGIAIKIKKPHARFNPAQYYCRKGFYAIPVQAMVDSDSQFRCFSAICVGATHDSLSHEVSGLGKFLREGRLLIPFWIAADEAYVCTEFLLTPFTASSFDRSSLSKYKDAFNFFHSSLRMHVEQAFGILVGRFGILWRPLSFSLETNTNIVLAAMLIHNFCIDEGNGLESEIMTPEEKKEQKRAFKFWYEQSRKNVFAQHEIASAATEGDRAMQKSIPRRDMVNLLTSLRLKRPYGQDRFDSDEDGEC